MHVVSELVEGLPLLTLFIMKGTVFLHTWTRNIGHGGLNRSKEKDLENYVYL